MIVEQVICDFCGKETTKAYFTVLSKVTQRNKEVCPDCWETAKKAISEYRPVKVFDAKGFNDEDIQ